MSLDILDTKQIQELELLDVVNGQEWILIDDGTYTKRTRVSNILGHIVNELNSIDRTTVIKMLDEMKKEIIEQTQKDLQDNTDKLNKEIAYKIKEINDKLVPSEVGKKVYPINGTMMTTLEIYNPQNDLGGEWTMLGKISALIFVSGVQTSVPLFLWKRIR